MMVDTPARTPRDWFAGKILLAYAVGGILLLGSAGGLKVLSTQGWEEKVFSLAPRPNAKGTEGVDKAKIRGALATLPAIFAKFGIALLGVAVLGGLVRSIEPEAEGETSADPDRRGSLRARDLAIPAALALVVLAQVGPSMNRPLRGDELENYDQHLVLSFQGMMTTMGGANNQLGYSILAWTSMRAFGDSPASVRLPALIGAMLLPVAAYGFGSRRLGRAGATAFGLLLALWPDCIMAGMQGRSYSLLMLMAVIHLEYFRRFATGGRSAGMFAATLAAACTLHLWFAIVAGAELAFLGLIKLDERLGSRVVGLRAPLRVETFLLYMTLGGLGAATVQAGILPKFVFVLTQKSPTPVDARAVLASMSESVRGSAFDNDGIDPAYRGGRAVGPLRTGVDLAAAIGLLACALAARKDASARFMVALYLSASTTFFLVVYAQKPVYLYGRFFAALPMILAWAGAEGWDHLLAPKARAEPVPASKPVPA